MAEVPVGHRIRARRHELAITQVDLARRVGVSPSYLNLIEHDRRRVGGGLLRRLAEALRMDQHTLSGAEDARIVAELAEIGTDSVFEDVRFDSEDAAQLLAASPRLTRAVLTLYRAYRTTLNQVDELSERVSRDPFLADANHQILTLITTIRSFSEILRDYGDLDDAQRRRFLATVVDNSENLSDLAQQVFDFLGGQGARRPFASPAQEVDDVLHDHGNFFPDLERPAQILRSRIGRRSGTLYAALIAHLDAHHGIHVTFRQAGELPPGGVRFDPEARCIELSEALPDATCRFQLARLLGRLEASEAVAGICEDERLTSDTARERCREAMLSYFAGALLYPYDTFLEVAEGERYDIAVLAQRFGGSFEQVAHRLTTLRRPGREGVPFHFMRTDIAGNISKRFSASGLRLPRYGGACPRWAIHQAFLTPGRLVRQLAEMPDGSRYLFVARTVERPAPGFGQPQSIHAIMIGCDAAFAARLVYADGIGPHLAGGTPVGTSCPQCPREDCAQRAFPRAMAGTSPEAQAAARSAESDIADPTK
ncbi:helix-turn-helix domain-containing protein [Ferruginivarius sediminum]|uniref:histidine kinase n=1 Tax=Ferruginivarius sediminum TaxID=2661937 RepID=A0A369T8V4_9PROT|nr:short-chain fatty acyl-CoA regulator family protein [Ferruginivarius sediminum]RDD61733.1 ImmA/IrrE family metallo-endopeptidase [Ferruginivarius sediminum]